MKGLALAEAFFSSVGRMLMATCSSKIKNRIAAGLVGMGSECFGFDDELSRDHDWGPGFCLWLNKDDYQRHGTCLQIAYDALPDEFEGFQRQISPWGAQRVGVFEIGAFYQAFIGSPETPQTHLKWLAIPEENLAACTNGKVFIDPAGDFSKIRAQLKSYYPEDVRLKKIAARCMSAAQSGQYNYARCLRRNDPYGMHCTLAQFVETILALLFLINRRFMPYFKWRLKTASELSIPPDSTFVHAIDRLFQDNPPAQKQLIIESLCQNVIDQLKAQGLSDSDSDFLLDHGPSVQSRIQDPTLRQLDIWYIGG